jgi:hypothetical protein
MVASANHRLLFSAFQQHEGRQQQQVGVDGCVAGAACVLHLSRFGNRFLTADLPGPGPAAG